MLDGMCTEVLLGENPCIQAAAMWPDLARQILFGALSSLQEHETTACASTAQFTQQSTIPSQGNPALPHHYNWFLAGDAGEEGRHSWR